MLQLINLSKSFVNEGSEAVHAVHQIHLEIKTGEFFSLLGPSGCGKTTLLRMIVGLESATSGQMLLNGRSIGHLSTQERPFNLIFQRYALFPHLSVFENVAFGLRIKKLAAPEVDRRVRDALNLVSMAHLAERAPETLSGGQAQRVAIARAIVNEPEILLLDEPLSALDQQLREHMQTELKALQKKLGVTFIYVTHDQEEALALSDRIGVMNRGRLEQVDEPRALYCEPQTLFVAQFIGANVILPGDLISVENGHAVVQVGAAIVRTKSVGISTSDRQVWISVRPDLITMTRLDKPSSQEMNELKAVVRGSLFKGLHSELELHLDSGAQVRVSIPQVELPPRLGIGDRVRLGFYPDDAHIFARSQ
jgi:spermidine/putrescine transport system ATP-binding protein